MEVDKLGNKNFKYLDKLKTITEDERKKMIRKRREKYIKKKEILTITTEFLIKY